MLYHTRTPNRAVSLGIDFKPNVHKAKTDGVEFNVIRDKLNLVFTP
jgi:hypothetical protein